MPVFTTRVLVSFLLGEVSVKWMDGWNAMSGRVLHVIINTSMSILCTRILVSYY